MKYRQFLIISFLLVFVIMQTGCSSFNRKIKDFLGGNSSSSSAPTAKQGPQMTKFSDSPDIVPRITRQYKRTTKESLANESALDARAGSLWVMEGQGAYLFSQNPVRLVGDPLAVHLEGDPRDQLQSKVNVIRKLIAKIEERQRQKLRGPAGEESTEKKKTDKTAKNDKSEKPAEPTPAADPAGDADLGIKSVPTRIVERTPDGNYRVKGVQPFMISGREYKVIVTGIVRAEEFDDQGIGAPKLLDSKFDIVSARRREGEM